MSAKSESPSLWEVRGEAARLRSEVHGRVRTLQVAHAPGSVMRWLFGRPDDPATRIASGTGFSLRLLYKEFEQDLGSSPRVELERMRMNEAKRLLLNGRSKIGAIAAQCGFENLRTFQRVFQRAEHLAPAKWRRASFEVACA